MAKSDRPKKETSDGEAGGSQEASEPNFPERSDKCHPTGKVATTQPNRKARRALSKAGQIAAALELLRRRPVDTFELRRMGMASPAARIQDLEAMGCVIDSARIVAVDSDGFSHYGVALYTLVSEPEVLADLEVSE